MNDHKNNWMSSGIYHLVISNTVQAIYFQTVSQWFTIKQSHQFNIKTNCKRLMSRKKNPPFKFIWFQKIWQHASYKNEGLDIVHSNTLGEHFNSENTTNSPKSSQTGEVG